MKKIVIGGDFSDDGGKPSSVIYKLTNILNSDITNGGSINDLETNANDLKGYDLIIWGPNITNEIEKIYPKKDTGSVLICTKVMRENRDFGDAVARVFKMNANAVIAIDSTEKPFKFTLIDALGNVWCSTSDLNELASRIEDLYDWSSSSFRTKTKSVEFTSEEQPKVNLNRLCDLVKRIADNVENERGGRYFGNVSTRCSKLFPSYRLDYDVVLMSARNISKERITPEDFVYTKQISGEVFYHNDIKPSVDTPIQLGLYNYFKNINFLIHGHAYIKDAVTTEKYFPCGDLREFLEITSLIHPSANKIIINLKNHGFLIGTSDLDQLTDLVDNLKFSYRKIGEEKVEINDKINI
jgi:hypothetical protein